MKLHEVKSWTYLFSAIVAGLKFHDIRDMTERDYEVGDHMRLNEFDPSTGQYTGRWAIVEITYITDRQTPCALSSVVLDRNFGVLSIKLLETNIKPEKQELHLVQ
jgi:uncharacterized protein YqfB (UPF0267 family)